MSQEGQLPADNPAQPVVVPRPEELPESQETPPISGDGHSRRIWIAIAVFGVLAVLIGGAFGYRAVVGRLAGARKIDAAQQLIVKADKSVVAIDKIIVSAVTVSNAKAANELSPTIAPAEQDLKAALKLLDEARPTATEDEQRKAGLLGDSARARLEMLAQAPTLLEATVKAANAKDLGEKGWKRANEADDLSDQAVSLFNKLNKASAQESAKYDAQAQTAWLEAKGLVQQAEAAFPQADFEPMLAYCDSKLAEVALSQQATSAYLKGDVKRANQLADAFNAEDKRLVEVAKGLPASAGDVVAKAYDRVAGVASKAYFSARENATKADDRLRRF